MRPNYTEFDALLLEQIAAGRNTMIQLDTTKSGLKDAAKPFMTTHASIRGEAMRIIDRRLQALRKAGRIRYNGKAWEVLGE